jgi:hypothetical protein
MLCCITLASVAQMFKWSYCFINFVPTNFLNYSNIVIPPNSQQDGEYETADMENCIDDLNDFHFKKPKVNLPTFDKSFTSKVDDNEENYFVVHKDWLIRKCDGYNRQDIEKNRPIHENINVNDQILVQGIIKHQHNRCVICDQQFHRMNEPTFDRIDNNKPHTLENCVLCCCKCNQ